MKRPSGKRDETPSRPITFRAAKELRAFALAELWCDRTAWPLTERTQYDELAELAVMSALAMWLHTWQPIAIHGAILAGARPEAVAGALGETIETAFTRWHEWAVEQRDFVINGKPGITVEEYEAVAYQFSLSKLLAVPRAGEILALGTAKHNEPPLHPLTHSAPQRTWVPSNSPNCGLTAL